MLDVPSRKNDDIPFHCCVVAFFLKSLLFLFIILVLITLVLLFISNGLIALSLWIDRCK